MGDVIWFSHHPPIPNSVSGLGCVFPKDELREVFGELPLCPRVNGVYFDEIHMGVDGLVEGDETEEENNHG